MYVGRYCTQGSSLSLEREIVDPRGTFWVKNNRSHNSFTAPLTPETTVVSATMVTRIVVEKCTYDTTNSIGGGACATIWMGIEDMRALRSQYTLSQPPSNFKLHWIFKNAGADFTEMLIGGHATVATPITCRVCQNNSATTVAGFPILHCSDHQGSLPRFVDYAAVPHCDSSVCTLKAGAHVAVIGSQRLERRYHCAYCHRGFGPMNRPRPCGVCLTARYCSDDCASAHRVDHGSVCDYIQRRRREAADSVPLLLH